MGDIIDCLNGFHYTFAKSMTYFFLFRRILYPLHIRLLHNTLYPQSIDLPASVLQTSAYIFLKLLLCRHPTHCLKASLSSATVFMLQKCNYPCSIFSFVCVVTNTTTEELHAQCYMSLSKPGVPSVGDQGLALLPDFGGF